MAQITDHRNGARTPFAFFREANPNKIISFYVNPSECSWTLGLRTSIDRIAAGAVHYDGYADRLDGKNKKVPRIMKFDLGQLRFSFQSGPVTPGVGIDVNRNTNVPPFVPLKDNTEKSTYSSYGNNTGGTSEGSPPVELYDVPFGLGNFYDFLELLDQPNVLSDGSPNFVNCNYLSAMFLPKLWIRGFFTAEGVSWTDSADSPTMITSWGATMDVCLTDPNLNDAKKLKSSLAGFHFKDLGLGK